MFWIVSVGNWGMVQAFLSGKIKWLSIPIVDSIDIPQAMRLLLKANVSDFITGAWWFMEST